MILRWTLKRDSTIRFTYTKKKLIEFEVTEGSMEIALFLIAVWLAYWIQNIIVWSENFYVLYGHTKCRYTQQILPHTKIEFYIVGIRSKYYKNQKWMIHSFTLCRKTCIRYSNKLEHKKEKIKYKKFCSENCCNLRPRRPSRTLYVRSWNAKSTAGLVGRWDSVFGWAGTICNLKAPLFLLALSKLLALSSSTIFYNFQFQFLFFLN